jgi:hypothetical protein
MHPDLLQELNELHIQDLHRGAERTRFTHPLQSIRRFRGETHGHGRRLRKTARECGTHA